MDVSWGERRGTVPTAPLQKKTLGYFWATVRYVLREGESRLHFYRDAVVHGPLPGTKATKVNGHKRLLRLGHHRVVELTKKAVYAIHITKSVFQDALGRTHVRKSAFYVDPHALITAGFEFAQLRKAAAPALPQGSAPAQPRFRKTSQRLATAIPVLAC
eukprot:2906081-Pyramimonas_sp.AAC.1